MKNRTIIKFLLILILLLLPLYAKADIAINSSNFPDDKFKTLLINCDTNTDGKLSDEEIAAINEIATSDEIYDLTGIEYLTELGSLTLWNSRLTALDLSKNTKLTSLRIDESSITEIDFSSNPNLTNLVLGWNHSLSKINIRKNVKLTHLSVFYSNISELDVRVCF